MPTIENSGMGKLEAMHTIFRRIAYMFYGNHEFDQSNAQAKKMKSSQTFLYKCSSQRYVEIVVTSKQPREQKP